MGIISDSCDMEFRSVNETLEYCNILCIARMRLYSAPLKWVGNLKKKKIPQFFFLNFRFKQFRVLRGEKLIFFVSLCI